MDFSAFQDSGRHSQVFITAAGTGAEKGIGHLRSLDFFDIMHEMPVRRHHYLRLDFGAVVLVGFNIFGVFVAVLRFEMYFGSRFEKVDNLLVGINDTGLRAGKHGEAAHRLPPIHAHVIHHRSGKFHDLVNCAVRADLTQDVFIDISAHDAVLQFARDIEFDAFRHTEPCPTGA